jgi:aspartate aminotransferase
MIDFTQAPIFKKYDVGDKESRQAIGDYSVQICEDILNDTGVVIVPGTDFGLPNSARLSLVLHKEAFLEAMGKLMRYLVKGLES